MNLLKLVKFEVPYFPLAQVQIIFLMLFKVATTKSSVLSSHLAEFIFSLLLYVILVHQHFSQLFLNFSLLVNQSHYFLRPHYFHLISFVPRLQAVIL